MIRPLLLPLLLSLLVAGSGLGQQFPSHIHGYKVEHAKVSVTTAADERPAGPEAWIRLGGPRIVELGLTGVTFEATAEVSGLSRSGDIDFLSFKDVVVNGIPIEADDYEHPFKIKKGESVELPVPLRGHVNTVNVAKAGYSEYTASKADWRVTGTVFVFARFKKFGMTFKRVIPVPLDLTIRNPLTAALER